LPEYLFPSASDVDASVVDTDAIREVCEVRVMWWEIIEHCVFAKVTVKKFVGCYCFSDSLGVIMLLLRFVLVILSLCSDPEEYICY